MAALPAPLEEASTEIVSDRVGATSTLPSVQIQTANQKQYTLSWKYEKASIKPKPKSKEEALLVADAIAMKLAELFMYLQQVTGEFKTEKDKLREEITLLQKQLDTLTLGNSELAEKYKRASSKMSAIEKENDELRQSKDELTQKYDRLKTELEAQHAQLEARNEIIQRLKTRLEESDSKLAMSGIGSWVEEARILILHKLGKTNVDRKTLHQEWYQLSESLRSDSKNKSEFNMVVKDLFGLKSYEWTKISKTFYYERNITVHYHPPKDEAMELLQKLPSPFSNLEYKSLFEKMIESVAKLVDDVEDNICA